MKNCPKSKCLLSVVAVFVFIFAYDWLVHGVLLKDAYVQTASLWRPIEEMQSLWPLCFVFHGALAILYSALFCMAARKDSSSCDANVPAAPTEEKKCCPIKKGVCFGTILGLLLGVMNGAAYMHIPIPVSLAVSWFFAGLGQGIGVGILLSLISNKKSCGK
jgi:hypothetical protein